MTNLENLKLNFLALYKKTPTHLKQAIVEYYASYVPIDTLRKWAKLD